MPKYQVYIPAYSQIITAKSKKQALEQFDYDCDIEDYQPIITIMPDLANADHPARQSAIKIIEQVIEPLLVKYADYDKGLNDIEYYQTEDAIVNLINK